MSPAPDPRTTRGRVGVAAEDVACRFLEALGWQVLARNLVVGRDEIDLVCLDDGALVCVEVRGHATSRFGAAEESVDGRKLARNHRAAMTLIHSGWPRQQGLASRVGWRVDVVAVELRPSLGRGAGGPSVRHIRGVTLD
ncbi:MAG: YraN family protein [Chloroflexi bacterium]|nr:YraN family protein [Chloroflexota bacterium]